MESGWSHGAACPSRILAGWTLPLTGGYVRRSGHGQALSRQALAAVYADDSADAFPAFADLCRVGGNNVFHAAWRPGDRQRRQQRSKSAPPSCLLIAALLAGGNYDAQGLKSKYGVTSQHTFVQTGCRQCIKWVSGDVDMFTHRSREVTKRVRARRSGLCAALCFCPFGTSGVLRARPPLFPSNLASRGGILNAAGECADGGRGMDREPFRTADGDSAAWVYQAMAFAERLEHSAG